MQRGRAKLILVLIVCLGGGWGCSASNGALPGLIPVKGKVTYKGKPLAHGVVVFEPDGYGREARGKLESDGTFILTTIEKGDGVVPGECRVYVTEIDKTLAKDKTFKKYMGAASSKLTAEVSADHTEFTFDLK